MLYFVNCHASENFALSIFGSVGLPRTTCVGKRPTFSIVLIKCGGRLTLDYRGIDLLAAIAVPRTTCVIRHFVHCKSFLNFCKLFCNSLFEKRENEKFFILPLRTFAGF